MLGALADRMFHLRNAIRSSDVCVVYHGPGITLDQSVRSRPANELFAGPSLVQAPAVLLMDASMLGRVGELRNFPWRIVVVAADPAIEETLGARADLTLAGLPAGNARERLLRTACDLAHTRLMAMDWKRQLVCARRDLHELNRIGIALMQEKDQNALLHQIVDKGKELTESDGGTLMLLRNRGENVQFISVAMWKVDSLPDLPDPKYEEDFPIDDTSILGHAVLSKETMVIDDAYNLPLDAVYVRSTQFDERFGYRLRSLLIVPMLDRRDNVEGVLLFANRKRHRRAMVRNKDDCDRWVLPYTRREVRLARSLASQAAVSIENTRLYAQIENLFESFVKAAATAIDQRDPTTAGHSLRVAKLTTDLAAAVEREGRGPYRDVRFSREQMRELNFAALLHDFGKVGVQEDVLLKAKKLPRYLWERVNARFDLIRSAKELEYYRKRARPRSGDGETPASQLDVEFADQLEEVERMRRVVRDANEPELLPELLPELPAAELLEIARRTYERDGRKMPYLTTEELRFLQIPKGTLNEHERAEIESHVDQTYQFLLQIPWTDDLKNLATYAFGHHEKLDGSGYPRRIKGSEIPLQTRLLAITDIFDALTESDRPYKPVCAVDRALDIMRSEAKAGALDSELVRILVDSQVYKRVLEQDWRRF